MFTIYTKQHCSYCVKAKELMDKEGWKYTEVMLNTNSLVDEVKRIFKEDYGVDIATVPQITKEVDGGDTYIGGYSELVKYYEDILEASVC